MTPMSDLLALAARVEALEGPDSLVDDEIGRLVGTFYPTETGPTYSLDAARSLIPDGASYEFTWRAVGKTASGWIAMPDDDLEDVWRVEFDQRFAASAINGERYFDVSSAPTEAAALTAASLRARAAMEKRDAG